MSFSHVWLIKAYGHKSHQIPAQLFLQKVGIKWGTGIHGVSASHSMSYLPDRSLTFKRSTSIGWNTDIVLEISEKINLGIGYRLGSGNILSDSSVVPASASQGERTLITYDYRAWEIPFSFRYFLHTGRVKPYLVGAVSLNKFSRFVFSKTKFAPWIPSGRDKTTSEEVSNNNWGYETGGGLLIDLTKGVSLLVDARYQFAEYYWKFDSREIKMNRVLVNFGVLFELKEARF